MRRQNVDTVLHYKSIHFISKQDFKERKNPRAIFSFRTN